jgi:hypothetical protein
MHLIFYPREDLHRAQVRRAVPPLLTVLNGATHQLDAAAVPPLLNPDELAVVAPATVRISRAEWSTAAA